MTRHRITDFITLHATCGEIQQEWGIGTASFRCKVCGAVLTCELSENAEFAVLADMADAIDAMHLSREDLDIVADPRTSPAQWASVLKAHPELRALLDAYYDAAQYRRPKH